MGAISSVKSISKNKEQKIMSCFEKYTLPLSLCPTSHEIKNNVINKNLYIWDGNSNVEMAGAEFKNKSEHNKAVFFVKGKRLRQK